VFRFVFFAVFIFAVPGSAVSQVVPSATEAQFPQWSIGAGGSYFNPDIGHSRIVGGTLWVDRGLGGPPLLRPISVEFEARDLRWDHAATSAPTQKINSEQLGGLYTFTPTDSFHQYLKVLVGRGSANFLQIEPTWRALSLAGGLTVRAHRHLWIRGEYEYQIFPNFFSPQVSRSAKAAALDPQGITVGAVYTVGRVRDR
jgi:hypothetical protein